MISTAAYKLAFWLLLIAVTILSMVAVPAQQQLFHWQDKLHHMGAYGALFLLLIRAYGDRLGLWLPAMGLVVFGLVMEVAQSFTGYRQAELWDLAANISGILLVGLILTYPRRNH